MSQCLDLLLLDTTTDGTAVVWVPDASPVDRWEAFDGIAVEEIADLEAVADWTTALAAAAADVDADAEDWALAGRGVALVAQDKEWAEALLHRYTVAAGLTPMVVEADDIERLEPGALEQHAPAVCLLQPGPWMAADDPNASPKERAATSALRDRILALFASFDVEQPVVLVTIVDEVTDLHESLRTVKRFDRFLHIPRRDDATWGAWLLACLGEEQFGPSIHGALPLAGRVFAREFETPRRRSLALLALARRASARQRPLEFVDLIDLCARGFVEGALPVKEEERHSVAVHEAGHAVMVMVEAGFRAVPEYSSIMPSLHWQGVMIDAAERWEHHPSVRSYRILRRMAREFLAGRAAEELVFGAEEAGNGAQSDLLKMTTLARQAFAMWGWAPDLASPGRSGANLAVLDDDPEQWSAQARDRVDAMVREFLRVEYGETLRILEEHRPLLDLLTERLLRDKVVAREGFVEEAARAGYAVRARGRPHGGR